MYTIYVAQHYIDKHVYIPMGIYCAPLVVDFFFVLLLERLHVGSF